MIIDCHTQRDKWMVKYFDMRKIWSPFTNTKSPFFDWKVFKFQPQTWSFGYKISVNNYQLGDVCSQTIFWKLFWMYTHLWIFGDKSFYPNICGEYACTLWHGATTLVGKCAHMNKKKSWIIFHVMSWNISNIFVYQMEILCDMVEYSMTCHGIFCHVTCVVCYGINNGLLILNMGLASRTIKSNIV
jgi:hypothetical protein